MEDKSGMVSGTVAVYCPGKGHSDRGKKRILLLLSDNDIILQCRDPHCKRDRGGWYKVHRDSDTGAIRVSRLPRRQYRLIESPSLILEEF